MDRLDNNQLDNQPVAFRHSAGIVEDAASLLWKAFREAPLCTAQREAVILSPEMREPPGLLVRRGTVYSAVMLADGRRAIPDIFLTGDIVGVEHAVAPRASLELRAADVVTYSVLMPAKLRELMADQQTAISIIALAAKQVRQREHHIAALARLNAHARIAGFLLGIYDRLRQHQQITRPSFALPLTQDQIGDHLGLTTVHVSRTLRRLREQRLALLDRHVVIITDLVGLRRVAAGGDDPVDETVRDELLGESGDRTAPTLMKQYDRPERPNHDGTGRTGSLI